MKIEINMIREEVAEMKELFDAVQVLVEDDLTTTEDIFHALIGS